MPATLISIVRFSSVAGSGGQSSASHGLTDSLGNALTPDIVIPSAANFSVSATSSTVTVTNNGTSSADVDVWCEYKFPMTRMIGNNTNLTPRPFAPSFTGGSGGGGAATDNIEVVASSASSSAYGNGVTYVPLRQGLADTIEFQWSASTAGTYEIAIVYAMSAANSGDIDLQLTYLIIANGGDPSAAATTASLFTVVPGSNTTIHTIDSTDSSTLSLTVTAGALIYCKLTRPNSDTHTGDIRVLQIAVRTAT